MKSISILGTSSNAGKSWLTTAFCALMKRKGLNVAPFKAQNMSNNSFVTLEGGEIGRAQAVQAEACGKRPITQMNPVLLKPSGDNLSQLVLNGKPGPHLPAGNYYEGIRSLWEEVASVLDWWKSHCDLLILEGAGSPVELNLMSRDIVNLAPIRYLNGKWILCCDIERGGVFAQGIGTVNLLPPEDRKRGLGLVVNKFRGDPALFDDAAAYFSSHIETPYLGVLPMRFDLQPETEDGFTLESESAIHPTIYWPEIAWIRFPHISNSQDIQPWSLDKGVQNRWIIHPESLQYAKAIVLPGSKNTIADLLWLRQTGLAERILELATQGVPVLGICGGYQMLGESLTDLEGVAGTAGSVKGLGLLPVHTDFQSEKRVSQVKAIWGDSTWSAYEIHMGRTRQTLLALEPLLKIHDSHKLENEGCKKDRIWGTYLHGFFESPATRTAFAKLAGIHSHQSNPVLWATHKEELYSQMADLLESHLDLESIYRHVGM